MLTVFRDGHGNIDSACEWWCVDEQGTWNPNGVYIWVNQLEVGKGIDGRHIITEVIRTIAKTCPWAKGAYWERREKDDDNRLHAFTRNRLLGGDRNGRK